ncbi:hypothetical protein [Butyrivibrio sp. AC2005]|uniref:hypothetical protein n=1 Tax=Butyrivibrio sp. AC2005 TaxID=1280672 RepID=UPI0004241836|nr:hypothetical protein [Butyrivibrio sp. AC2005]
MIKNRVRIFLIAVIVAVILTNYEKAVNKIVVSTDKTELSKEIEYKVVRISYEDGVNREYINKVNSEIKTLPANIISQLSDTDIEIRIIKKQSQSNAKNIDINNIGGADSQITKIITISEGDLNVNDKIQKAVAEVRP